MASQAIAIGINQYEFLQPLQYARQDAIAVQTFLQQEARFERVFYFSDDSPLINGKSTRPTRNNLRRVLREIFAEPFLKDGDDFWFFFSGHGMRDNERDYLMPIDGDPNDIAESGISIQLVTDYLRRSGADNVVLLLDACRSGGRKDGSGLGHDTEQISKQTGVISIFSCSPNQYSYEFEALGQGAFTTVLLEGLAMPGGTCATVSRLDHYLQDRVPKVVQQHFPQAQQRPYTIAEPIAKAHQILIPRHARPSDAEPLRIDALRAETQGKYTLAKRCWIRVLSVCPADGEAIDSIIRLARLTDSNPPVPAPSTSPPPSSKGTATHPQHIHPLPDFAETLAKDVSLEMVAIPAGEFWMGAKDKGTAPTISPLLPIVQEPPPPPALSTRAYAIEVAAQRLGLREKRPVSPPTVASFAETLAKDVTLEMVAIPAGEFWMGAKDNEEGASHDEYPRHQVKAPAFSMGRYPVTQAQWAAVAQLPKVNIDLEPDPAKFKGKNRPVEQISWFDAVEFCDRLSRKTGKTYRLPSEAEWEYACRAGTETPFHFGGTLSTEIANYNGNHTYSKGVKGEYRGQTTPVGSFPANAFGLNDMHGNVCEWCADHWHETYNRAPTDGSAWIEGRNSYRWLVRGGSWYLNPANCRSANRVNVNPARCSYDIGFRVVVVGS
jgi:formylglycine-generating enzyme required for sulfatase activity